MKARQRLRRYHIWLGWLVGLPVLLWCLSGLVMVIKPITEVRGEGLLRPAPALALEAPPVPPAIGPRPVSSLSLEQRDDGARWLIHYEGGGGRLADPATGSLLAPIRKHT